MQRLKVLTAAVRPRSASQPHHPGLLLRAGICALFVCSAVPVRAAPGDVDTRESLVIGSYKVSAYRVDKNYRRFADSTAQPGHAPPAPAAVHAWFARFLTQQVLIARALQEGYGERAEVQAEVDRMERHMLTQSGGPFYEHLCVARSASLPTVDALYERARNIYDVEILRLSKDAPAAAEIERAFGQESPVEFERALTTARASGHAESYDGPISWPFKPFEEIAETLGQAPLRSWQKLSTDDDLLFYYVRRIKPARLPPPDRVGPSLLQVARFTNERCVQRERRSRVLHEAGFVFHWETANRLAHRLLALKPDPLLPPATDALPDLAAMPLGTFAHPAGRPAVTVADYIHYYNNLFVRELPSSATDIHESVRALVLAQRDYDDARVLGIHLQAKFREDRENYRNSLTLDLYERERIRPKLGVTDDDIAGFYHGHLDAYTRPSRVEGVIVTFDQMDAAKTFAGSPAARAPVSPPEHARSVVEVTLTKTSEIPDMKYLPIMVFSGPTIAPVLGPFPVGDAFSVWVTKKTLESETQPLAAVARTIRTQLEQPLLEKYEADLARELSRRTTVEDHVDYGKYGLSEMPAKPWSG